MKKIVLFQQLFSENTISIHQLFIIYKLYFELIDKTSFKWKRNGNFLLCDISFFIFTSYFRFIHNETFFGIIFSISRDFKFQPSLIITSLSFLNDRIINIIVYSMSKSNLNIFYLFTKEFFSLILGFVYGPGNWFTLWHVRDITSSVNKWYRAFISPQTIPILSTFLLEFTEDI